MEILSVLQAIWRRRIILFASLGLFVICGVLLTFLVPKQYKAESLLEIKSQDQTASLLNELGMAEMAMTLTSGDEEMLDKIYIALAPPVMEQVVWRMQLRDEDGYLYKAEDVNEVGLLSPLVGKPGFELAQEQGTSVLVVTAYGPSKEAAQLMADTISQVYIDQGTEIARAETREAQRFIVEQIDAVRAELDRVYSEKARVQKNNDVIDMEWEIKSAVQRISDLYLEYQLVVAKIEETKGRLYHSRMWRDKERQAGGSPVAMQDDPVIHELRSRLWSLTRERDALLNNGRTQKAPEVVEKTAEIAATRVLIDEELANLAELDPEVANLESELYGLQNKAREIQDLAQRTTTEFANYPERMREVAGLDLAGDAIETVYKSLADQQYQIGVAEAMTMSDTRVLSQAKLPEKHSSPNLILNLLAGIVLGLGFGVAGALAMEYIDDTVQNADDLRKVWDLPQLGVIFKYGAKGGVPAVAQLPATDPIVEAYRTVRNSIEFASLDKPIQILAVTSSIPGEGKSTTAINIAASIARDGKRVLMVDGDLRLPTQHRQFPETVVAPGLVEVLTRTNTPAEAVQETPVENLFLLAAGTSPPDPGHLVESLRMRQVLLELARSYDVVLVDAPPVLAVNDPIVLSRVVDATVVVVECSKATRRMLNEVQTRFENVRTTPIGLVLNKVRASANQFGAYAKQYQVRAQKREATSTASPDEGAA